MSPSGPLSALRALAVEGGGVLLVVLGLAASFLATDVRDSQYLVPGWTTEQDVPGTCHDDQDYFESELTSAELTPSVPCTDPHTSEVVWTVELTGILAEQDDRPTPEMLAGQYYGLCQDPGRLASYVGADGRGLLYFLGLHIRYPSAPEWRSGLRTARCLAVPSYQVAPFVRPVLNFPLQGSWTRTGSAAIRLCSTGGPRFLPCDQPHTEEVLLPVSPFPETQIDFPPPALSIELGLAPCTQVALDMLGTTTLPPGVTVVVAPAELKNWPQNRDVGCRIATAERIGTLVPGLT